MSISSTSSCSSYMSQLSPPVLQQLENSILSAVGDQQNSDAEINNAEVNVNKSQLTVGDDDILLNRIKSIECNSSICQ